MKQETKEKRSYALPITLLILVLSLMLNVVLYTNQITNTRIQSEQSGEVIFEAFQQSQSDLQTMITFVSEVIEFTEVQADTTASIALDHAIVFSEHANQSLDLILSEAHSLESKRFEKGSEAAENYWHEYVQARLIAMQSDSGSNTNHEMEQLVGIRTSLEQLIAIVMKFDFLLEGDSNSLIQISNGIHWLDLAEQLQVQLLHNVNNPL